MCILYICIYVCGSAAAAAVGAVCATLSVSLQLHLRALHTYKGKIDKPQSGIVYIFRLKCAKRL